MKVLVIGGCGRVGKGAVVDFVNSPDVSDVVIGDINAEEAAKYIEAVGSNKLKYEHINLNDYDSLVSKIKRYDVVANAALYSSVVDVTKAAIEAKRHCSDAGGFYYHSLKQMELHEAAKNAGITVVMGLGTSPGITNVCVRYGADKLDEVDEIHISASGSIPKPGSKVIGRGMTIRTGFEELTDRPMVYRDGKMITVQPRTGEEKVIFPAPLGERTVYYARHGEMATLPGFRGAKTVDFKIYFSPESMQQMRILEDLGLLSADSIKVGDVLIEPREVVLQCLCSDPKETKPPEGVDITGNHVVVSGKKDGECVQYTYDLVGERDFRYGNAKTGIPLSIGCQMLGNGDVKEKGVLPPEACIDPEKFFSELRKRDGFALTEEYRRIRPL